MENSAMMNINRQQNNRSNMGLLENIDETIKRGDKVVELLQKREELFADLLNCASANIVVTNRNLPQLLSEVLVKAHFDLSIHKGREIVSIDCEGMTNADALGAMVAIANRVKQMPNLIVIINNIADPNCENPQYVENLFGHSWKNEKVFFDEYCIDRSDLTVILTATPEQKDDVYQKFRLDSYYCTESFDKDLEEIQEYLDSM